MAKEPIAAQDEQPQTFDLTLEEFCRQRSSSDNRVELLGGFFADTRSKGLFKAPAAEFEAAFEAFATRPA